MKPEYIKISHDDFSRRFSMRAKNLMWLLGADASASAGIPTAWDMIWEFKLSAAAAWVASMTIAGSPAASSPREEGRVEAGLEADPRDLFRPGRPDHRRDRLGRARHRSLADHTAGGIHDAHRRSPDRHVQTDIDHDRLTPGHDRRRQRQAGVATGPPRASRPGYPILLIPGMQVGTYARDVVAASP